MSDNAVETGAPSAKEADKKSDKVTRKEVEVPRNVVSAAKQIDHTILRLNK